jgi:hypothetical protein
MSELSIFIKESLLFKHRKSFNDIINNLSIWFGILFIICNIVLFILRIVLSK